MIIKPMVRNNICVNSHPYGCAAVVRRQTDYARKTLAAGAGAGGKFSPEGRNSVPGLPRLALVIGCSTGYGLASRICAAFGYGAATVGVSLEKPAGESKPGTPGYYNNLAFDREAEKAGLARVTLDGDAFSGAMKARAVEAVRETAKAAGLPPQVDLIVYSLASLVRTDPKDGVTYRSVIKPIGKSYSGKTIDMMTAKFITAAVEPATEEEAAHTVKVMGGEDWELWIDALDRAGVLAPAARTVAYTYIGPELSRAIYRNGTIGRAKEDLERACRAINKKFGGRERPEKGGGRAAWVSVNKALVTRASAVIPIIPFYVSCLFKVMKEMGLHEGCVEQIARLYRDRLYASGALEDPALVPVDDEGRIRIDDWEMREDVQKAVLDRMALATDDNILTVTDAAGFRHDFLEVHGFDVEGIDYGRDADPSGADI